MKIYGIFWTNGAGRAVWMMGRNKRNAIRRAKEIGAEVRVLSDDPSVSAWDAPTFHVLSDLVADYRP